MRRSIPDPKHNPGLWRLAAVVALLLCCVVAQPAASAPERTGGQAAATDPAELRKRIDTLEIKLAARVRAVRNLMRHLRASEGQREELQKLCRELQARAVSREEHERAMAKLRTQSETRQARAALLEAEVRALERQVTAARAAQKEAHDAERTRLRGQLAETEQLRQALAAELGALQQSTVARKVHEKAVDRLRAELVRAQARVKALDTELTVVRAKVPNKPVVARDEHEAKLKQLGAELAAKSKRLDSVAKELARAKTELAAQRTSDDDAAGLKKALRQAEAKLEAMETEAAALRAKIPTAKIMTMAEHERRTTDLRKAIVLRDTRIAALEKAVDDGRASTIGLDAHRSKLKELRSSATQAEARARTLQTRLDALQAGTKSEAAAAQRRHDAALAELRSSLASREERVARLEDVRDALEKQVAALQQPQQGTDAGAGKVSPARAPETDVRYLYSEIAGLQARVADLADGKRSPELRQLLGRSLQMVAALQGEIARLRRDTTAPAPETRASIAKHFEAAERAEQNRNMEKAIWHYEKILTLAPFELRAHVALGKALIARGQDSAAERVLSDAVVLFPNEVRIMKLLGFASLRQEKAKLATSMFTRALALGHEDASLQHHLALACRALGWTTGAEASFRRAFRLDSTSHQSAFNLAVLLATASPPRVDEARAWYGRARQAGCPTDAGLESFFREHGAAAIE